MIESSLKLLCPGSGYEDFRSHGLSQWYNKEIKYKQSILLTINNKVNKSTENNSYKCTASENLDSLITALHAWSHKIHTCSIE